MLKKFFSQSALAAGVLIALSACGTSTESENDSNATNNPPVVKISSGTEFQEGSIVNLVASATDENGSIQSYHWKQISGPAVQLSGDTKSTSSFTAPQVSGKSDLVFEVVVKDNSDSTASAQATIVITDEVITSPQRALEKLVEVGELPALDTSDDIAGPDTNSNGVRDDVDAYILSLPVTPSQVTRLQELAKYLQLAITVEPSTRQNPNEFAQKKALAQFCATTSFTDRKLARQYLQKIQAYTANTYERALKYNDYNHSRNGSVLTLPTASDCN